VDGEGVGACLESLTVRVHVLQEWFRKEKQRIEDEIREAMQEAVSNVHILNQNMEHLNDVVRLRRCLLIYCCH
jgi:peptidyl-tRNA hydrolase